MTQSQFSWRCYPNPLKDWQLLLVLIASLLIGVGMWSLMPKGFTADIVASPLLLMNTLLFFPVVEELLFRGVIQPVLLQRRLLAICHYGVSRANIITSILFVGLHFFNNSAGWALAVMLPSLTLGYMRERYQNLIVPVLLHSFFNLIFLFAGIL